MLHSSLEGSWARVTVTSVGYLPLEDIGPEQRVTNAEHGPDLYMSNNFHGENIPLASIEELRISHSCQTGTGSASESEKVSNFQSVTWPL